MRERIFGQYLKHWAGVTMMGRTDMGQTRMANDDHG